MLLRFGLLHVNEVPEDAHWHALPAAPPGHQTTSLHVLSHLLADNAAAGQQLLLSDPCVGQERGAAASADGAAHSVQSCLQLDAPCNDSSLEARRPYKWTVMGR